MAARWSRTVRPKKVMQQVPQQPDRAVSDGLPSQIPVPGQSGGGLRSKTLRILQLIGAKANNLQNMTAEIPLGTFTCVTGVSGSGKSTLIIETLYKAARAPVERRAPHPGGRSRRDSRASEFSTR